MTLGHVYDLDLKKNENPIKEVIIQAQGEVRPTIGTLIFEGFIGCVLDGFGGVYQTGQGDMDQLHTRSRQLPEQMSANSVSVVRNNLSCTHVLISLLEDGMTCSRSVARI